MNDARLTSSGQRRSTPEAVRCLHVIDVAKRAGFTLGEFEGHCVA